MLKTNNTYNNSNKSVKGNPTKNNYRGNFSANALKINRKEINSRNIPVKKGNSKQVSYHTYERANSKPKYGYGSNRNLRKINEKNRISRRTNIIKKNITRYFKHFKKVTQRWGGIFNYFSFKALAGIKHKHKNIFRGLRSRCYGGNLVQRSPVFKRYNTWTRIKPTLKLQHHLFLRLNAWQHLFKNRWARVLRLNNRKQNLHSYKKFLARRTFLNGIRSTVLFLKRVAARKRALESTMLKLSTMYNKSYFAQTQKMSSRFMGFLTRNSKKVVLKKTVSIKPVKPSKYLPRLLKAQFFEFWFLNGRPAWLQRASKLTPAGVSRFLWALWRHYPRTPRVIRIKKQFKLNWPKALKHRAFSNGTLRYFSRNQYNLRYFLTRWKKLPLFVKKIKKGNKKLIETPRRGVNKKKRNTGNTKLRFLRRGALFRLITMKYRYTFSKRLGRGGAFNFNLFSSFGQMSKGLIFTNLRAFNNFNKSATIKAMSGSQAARGLFLKRLRNNLSLKNPFVHPFKGRLWLTNVSRDYSASNDFTKVFKNVAVAFNVSFLKNFQNRILKLNRNFDLRLDAKKNSSNLRTPRRNRLLTLNKNPKKYTLVVRFARRNIFMTVASSSTGAVLKCFSSGIAVGAKNTARTRIAVPTFKRIQFFVTNYLLLNKIQLYKLCFIQDKFGSKLKTPKRGIKQFIKFLHSHGQRGLRKVFINIKKPHGLGIRQSTRRRK